MITALRSSLEVDWLCGLRPPLRRHRIQEAPAALGLHDGYAWNLERLLCWVSSFCPVDWQPLTSRQTYCSNKCKQKAYRERNKMEESTHVLTNQKTGKPVLVLVPDNDRAARIAMIAYANAVFDENPLLAEHLQEWVIDLNLDTPMPAKPKEAFELPEWLLNQSKTQVVESDNDTLSN